MKLKKKIKFKKVSWAKNNNKKNEDQIWHKNKMTWCFFNSVWTSTRLEERRERKVWGREKFHWHPIIISQPTHTILSDKTWCTVSNATMDGCVWQPEKATYTTLNIKLPPHAGTWDPHASQVNLLIQAHYIYFSFNFGPLTLNYFTLI
jgi:hypothetical protein